MFLIVLRPLLDPYCCEQRVSLDLKRGELDNLLGNDIPKMKMMMDTMKMMVGIQPTDPT